MAQLPPKVPNMAPNWPNLSSHSPHQTMPLMDNLATSQAHSWVDEFLNFSSSSKRGSHRRSASDSIAFLDQVGLDHEEDCGVRSSASGSRISHAAAATEFDRFDEEQFMAMFTDDVSMVPAVDCSNSSPSDHNSMEDYSTKRGTTTSTDQQMQQLGTEFEESERALDDREAAAAAVATIDNYNDRIFDPKRVKRILANRQSAQRSRVRKLQYVSELERALNSLQAEISVLSPRVAFLDHQRLVLNVDNSVLKQRIAALSQDKIFKDGHQEALKREIERLRQVYNYQQQNVKKIENDEAASPSAKSLIQSSPDKISDHPNCSAFNEQIMIR